MPTLGQVFPVLLSVCGESEIHSAIGIGYSEELQGHELSTDTAHWIADQLYDYPDVRLSSMFPVLPWDSEEPIGDIPDLAVRARRALQRDDIHIWSDLEQETVGSLLRIHNVGRKLVLEVLCVCTERSASLASSGGTASLPRESQSKSGSSEDSDGVPSEADGIKGSWSSAWEEVVEHLQLIIDWAQIEGSAGSLGDLLSMRDPKRLPSSVLNSWNEVRRHSILGLARPEVRATDFESLLIELVESLEERQRNVFEERVLSEAPPTLAEMGEALDVSRERVRQLEVKALRHIDQQLASDVFLPICWRAKVLSQDWGVGAPVNHPTTKVTIAHVFRDCSMGTQKRFLPLMLKLAGPYETEGGWYVAEGESLPSAEEISEMSDEFGIVSLADAEGFLEEHGLKKEVREAWMEEAGIRKFGDSLALWPRNVVDKCVALLALSGEPADADTLVEEVGEGHDVRGVRQRFFDDPRLVRVNRREWGLRAWGLEEYTGIVDEIEQRIREAGGQIEVQKLVYELATRFDLPERSVRAYVEAPMFVREAGRVRLRRADEPFPLHEDVSRSRGVYRTGAEEIALVLEVDRDVLRGSGRSVSVPVSAILGVQPGGRREFSAVEGQVSLGWPESSTQPRLGSIREQAEGVGALEGDWLRLIFDGTAGTVSVKRIQPNALEELPAVEAVGKLTGVDVGAGGAWRAMGKALGVPEGRVGRTLLERGDEAVAELLPRPDLDEGVEVALGELADVLEELE